MNNKVIIADLRKLKDRSPTYALVRSTDLVVVKYDKSVSVFYGRCLHRGALMADGFVEGQNLICGVHNWDYRLDTGISQYNNEEKLHKFNTIIEANNVYVDEEEIKEYEKEFPPSINREEYLGLYKSIHPAPEEDKVDEIQQLANFGLSKVEHC